MKKFLVIFVFSMRVWPEIGAPTNITHMIEILKKKVEAARLAEAKAVKIAEEAERLAVAQLEEEKRKAQRRYYAL